MKNAIYDFTEDILIVSLCGEIDHHNAASIRREIDESMTAFHAKNLILDYSDVSFMDCSRHRAGHGTIQQSERSGRFYRHRTGSPYVSRVLGLSGLFGLIPKTSSKRSALEYIYEKGGKGNETGKLV